MSPLFINTRICKVDSTHPWGQIFKVKIRCGDHRQHTDILLPGTPPFLAHHFRAHCIRGHYQNHIFNIGDTATDDELKITVNNVRFTTKIDEVDNEYLVAEASSGKQYVIVDITVENILSNKTQSISTSLETEVIDSEGYTYDSNFNGEMALDKAFKDGDILPGMKKRGELVYEVPMSAEDLTFAYKFDLFGGTTALFDIK
jgi:hypothetical protein